MGLQVDRVDDELVLDLDGDVDLENAHEPYEAVVAALEPPAGVSRVVVDLRRVAFIDSRGLGGLIRAKQEADRAQVAFRLRNLDPRVARVLAMTGLDQEFTIEPTQV